MSATDNTKSIEHLDFTVTCDVRGGVLINPGPACTAPAEFTVQLHKCPHPGPGASMPGFFCAEHLAKATLWFQQNAGPVISIAGYARCRTCGAPFHSIADWIWNVQPIH